MFNTPTGFTHFRPIFGLLFENVVGMLRATSGPLLPCTPFFCVAEEAAMLAARVLAIVRGWSAWRALQPRKQGCRPHRRQAKDGAAILARLADGDGPEGHLVKFLKKIFAARGDATRPRPAPPRQSSANWPGNRRPEPSGRPYRPCFSHSDTSPTLWTGLINSDVRYTERPSFQRVNSSALRMRPWSLRSIRSHHCTGSRRSRRRCLAPFPSRTP